MYKRVVAPPIPQHCIAFYNLGPRRSDLDGLRGQHLDTPRLIMQQGALLLQVPSPREATVPHRELPGLSFG